MYVLDTEGNVKLYKCKCICICMHVYNVLLSLNCFLYILTTMAFCLLASPHLASRFLTFRVMYWCGE